MPPPDDGNEYLPFERLLQVERLADSTFRSVALPFSPGGVGGSHGAAYGGHVFMQAAWAACLTVADGFLLSNVTGHFLLPALPTAQYIYKVQTIRDGRSYCTKAVHVTQQEERGIMFTCVCVFKKAETSAMDVQATTNLWDKYHAVLAAKRPHDFAEPSGIDAPWYWARRKATGHNEAFPGLDMRKAEMAAYNATRHPLDRRQLVFYRSLGTLPPADPNVHLCAHLYASDRNGLFFVANHYEVGDHYAGIGSLTHQVVFHGAVGSAAFGADRGPGTASWFCKEDWTTRLACGRAMLHGRLWSAEGVHIASVTQDGMLRLPRGKDGEMREIQRRWDGLAQEDTGRDGKQAGKL